MTHFFKSARLFKVSQNSFSKVVWRYQSHSKSTPKRNKPRNKPVIEPHKLLENARPLFDEALNADQVQFEKSVYPESQQKKNSRNNYNRDEPVDPIKYLDDSDGSVLLFPGQGSQVVGMGEKLLETKNVRDMFDRASQILEFDLLKVCLKGPQSLLDQTIYTQPAVVVSSLAAVEQLYQENPKAVEKCVAAAGFSVGEITALIFSGALSFDDGISLVKTRAEAMQLCSDMVPSGMMTIFFGADAKITLACEAAQKWTAEKHDLVNPVCQVATYLYSGAKVIGGHEQALQFIEANKSDFGIRRTKRLPVSGAFHTPLMKPALPILNESLRKMLIHNPRIPVFSNADQFVYMNEHQVRKRLAHQVVKQCKWEQSMNKIFKYADTAYYPQVYECGPGQGSLSGILLKINGKAGRKSKSVSV